MDRKKLLLIVLSLFALSAGTALAQDFDHTGAYLGAHLGWVWGDINYSEPAFPGTHINPSFDSFRGGAIAGYKHQLEKLVLGVEVDGGIGNQNLGPGIDGNDYSRFDLDWTAHVRNHIGIAADRTHLFVSGGLAVAELKVDDRDPGWGHSSATHVGWTVGGGLEHNFMDHLAFRVEYLYDNYGQADHRISAPAGDPLFPGYAAETDMHMHQARAALLFTF